MSDDTQLTIDGDTLDEELTIETSGRVIRPFNRMIGEVVDKYKLSATDDGLHVRAVDPPNVMYVDATIPADELEPLSIQGDETAIGVNRSLFGSTLSEARYGKSTDDPVTLSADGATLEATVNRDYGGVPATVTDRLELVDPAAIRSEPDLVTRDRVSFALPPDAFIDIVSSFGDSEDIAVTVSDGVAAFTGETDTRAREIALDVDADGEVGKTHFSASYLESVADGLKTGYAETATVHVDEEWPLTVRATTEQNIKVEYTLAPRVKRESPNPAP